MNADSKKQTGWVTVGLPDSDMLVLVRIEQTDEPIWPGFHDGDCWRTADGSDVRGRVTGWMDLHDAAAVLDLCKSATSAGKPS